MEQTVGASIVKDILPGEDHSSITWNFGKAFEPFNGNLYFTANDTPGSLNGVWRTDATEEGTLEIPSEFTGFSAPRIVRCSGQPGVFRCQQGRREQPGALDE